MEELSLRWLAGQGVSLVALALCVIAFASKRDDKLFVLLLFANVAFATQFALLESWVAAGISALIVVRIALVRRFPRHRALMVGMLLATLAVAVLTWSGPRDLPALAAGLLGTWGMFMLRGIAMRVTLAVAAFCWVLSNLLAGSIGGTLAESLIFITNVVTILRLRRDGRPVLP
ncbi:YgjV family protein [Halomonas pacifica]|uniref:Permease n=1 Tax=Bisbaumannia pacifica TaxID=77098 RepID=A0A510X344_9GAMM|nr:YgjV family protein [Halomonas pacifica]MDC8803019.1 YgjV family protein [Halomonas pacifica]GEK45832.1 permease [Halomonas pacifica]